MKKLIVVLVVSVILMGCNDPPLPALVNNYKVCTPSNCAMDYPESVVYAHNHTNYPDKHFDSVLGHHDFSVEADH